jgi:hypothetical protein
MKTNGESPPRRWLNQREAVDYLRTTTRQLQLLQRQGRVPVSYALGPKSPRYDQLALDQWMKESEAGGDGQEHDGAGDSHGKEPGSGD